MAVSFSSISGRVCPAWQPAFQASLEEPILHGSQLFKHLWKSLSCRAVSFSSISGMVHPAWQSAFQASLEESILHGCELSKHLWKKSLFSSSSGRDPAWQSAFQASLEESNLHGSQLFKHLWKSLPCMAVSFSSISGRVYPAWQ